MESELLKLVLPTLGPTGGCVAVVWMFIRFLSNHMGENTRAMKDVAAMLGELKGKVDDCPARER